MAITITNASVLLSSLLFLGYLIHYCQSVDRVTVDQSITDGKTLISAGEIMVLGFFSPGSPQDRYLGIWYKMDPASTVVWVANRENPVRDSSGVLKISTNGNLVILNGNGSTVWSSNVPGVPNKSRIAQLLDTGNIVLIEDGDLKWQSFDFPTDTLLTGMKLGLNRKTGLKRVLTSWRSLDDPSPGNFTSGIDPSGSPQLMTWDKSVRFFRGGPWNGQRYTGFPEMKQNYIFNFNFINNPDEISYTANLLNSSIFSRLLLNPAGVLQRFIWSERNHSWIFIWSHPKDQCDYFGECGSFGNCNSDDWPFCSCLQGFEPKSPPDWYLKDFREGCLRKTHLKCGTEDGFLLLTGMKLPDTTLAEVDESLSLKDCEDKCLKNCSCTAYANSNILGIGSGCVIWIGNLIDLREFPNNGEDLYIRTAASELASVVKKQSKSSSRGKGVIAIVTGTIVLAVILIGFIGFCLWKKNLKGKEEKRTDEASLFELGTNTASTHNIFATNNLREGRNNDPDLPLLDLSVVAAATNNFSDENKLGEGGFGPVYKGMLPDGQIVAVKRLSMRSLQGRHEFKNEVILISKLQHRNLVRLLGCCIHGEENILIYEYMPNKSLDLFLFDKTKSTVLDWTTRYNIIIGIARGLLYLHQDSRLRIIHRDLKASNILLDDQMNPKISDFGMARIFGDSQIQANTKTVVGTYGYMAPEYIMDGLFSVKSDVYSFGVLLLEIVSGKSNRGFYHCEHSLNLLGHAWTLWQECRGLELLDHSIEDSSSTSTALRSIQVGLLCVQEFATDRPDMASVLSMLSSETITLPLPGKPGLSTGRTLVEIESSSTGKRVCSINEVTASVLEPR